MWWIQKVELGNVTRVIASEACKQCDAFKGSREGCRRQSLEKMTCLELHQMQKAELGKYVKGIASETCKRCDAFDGSRKGFDCDVCRTSSDAEGQT